MEKILQFIKENYSLIESDNFVEKKSLSILMENTFNKFLKEKLS